MKQLTKEQIERLQKLASRSTSVENCGDEWNPYEISGGNFNDAYDVGYNDSNIENARFILRLFGIEYEID